MGRRLLVLWAGRHRRDAWETLCADYRGRIARDLEIEDRMIKARAAGSDPGRLKAEGAALLAARPEPCWTVALDPRARARSSDALAADLRDWLDTWPHAIAFVIGSDLGLDSSVLEAARTRLSFGPIVLGHELARLVLYEQLYRALSADRGIKYHRA
ncbi:MAG: 23S rRNA (pseudouridine(1915)-N(3))-methyltransferase RlmH [Acidobacteriota bacterium]